MSAKQGDYYQLLGIDQNATASEIEEAFERQIASQHQDLSAADESEISFLHYVHEVLTDPKRRKIYDSLLNDATAPQLAADVKVSNQNLNLVDIPQILYLLIDIYSGDIIEEKIRPLNLCLVIDSSTSMRGERLEQVKNGLRLLIDKLSNGDVLSLIRFSDRAQVVLPAGRLGQQKDILANIQSLHAAGGTEIFHGLSAGVGQLRQMASADYNNTLVLITDGRTYGDEEKCLSLARQMSEDGITLSAFGIGTDWDDQFLEALVGGSGGHLEYISSAEDIISTLKKNVQGMGQVVADRLKLRAKWPRGLELLDGFRIAPYAQPLSIDDSLINLGEISGHAPLRILLEFEIQPQTIPTRIRIPLRFEAKMAQKGKTKFEEKVSISIIQDAQPTLPPAEIVRAVRLLTLHRLNEKVWREVEEGQIERAAVRLNHLSTRFLEAGEDILAGHAQAEAMRLSRMETLSPGAYKNLRYGTRSLMGKTIQLVEDD